MADMWQTIEEAALTLRISTRTLHRRISKGEFQTRMNANRREILVPLPEPPAHPVHAGEDVTDTSTGSFNRTEHVAATSASPVETTDGVVDENSGALTLISEQSLALMEDRLHRTDLALSAFRQSAMLTAGEMRRARRSAAIAWSMVGVLGVLIVIATAWTTGRVTEAQGQVQHLSGKIKDLADTADKAGQVADTARRETDKLRQELVETKVTAARLDGQLQTAQQNLAEVRQPATRPVGFWSALFTSASATRPTR